MLPYGARIVVLLSLIVLSVLPDLALDIYADGVFPGHGLGI